MALDILITTEIAALRFRPTRYELAVDGRYLAGYCRLSKQGILAVLRQHGEAWAARIGPNDTLTFPKGARSATLGTYAIAFTGRTQRSAIWEGELPWALDHIPPIIDTEEAS